MPSLPATDRKLLFFRLIDWLIKDKGRGTLALPGLILLLLVSSQARAQSQSFTLTFYGVLYPSAAIQTNLSKYTFIFNGTFEIASSALGPSNAGGLILYRDPAFLAFDAPFTTPHGSYDFNLANPNDKFPGDPYPVNNVTKSDAVQGLRLDEGGQPQRFDTPSTFLGNGSEIREFTPISAGRQRQLRDLNLLDNDSFNWVLLADGSLVQTKNLAGRVPVAAVGGTWALNAGQGDGVPYEGIYIIAATPSITLVDPVPDLLAGSGISTDANTLATYGRVVSGVGADGVSRVLVRITATQTGEQFAVSLLNDQGQASSSSTEDGGLGQISDSSFGQNSLTVTAVDTDQGPMAFAVYQAPADFPRGSGQDALAASRSVSVQVTDATTGSTSSANITILRPPVVLVHGLWGKPDNWDSFQPVIRDPHNRFSVTRADYSTLIGSSISSYSPGDSNRLVQLALNAAISKKARSSALGFSYNASIVLQQIGLAVNTFKTGTNVAGLHVAAIQADVIAHSMGGDITRYLPLLGNFYTVDNFSAGPVHKVVTIDTPHLGSPLAFDLLQDANRCVRNIFTLAGFTVLNSATLSSGATIDGAIADISHDPNGGTFSTALQTLHEVSTLRLPTALIASSMSQAELNTIDSPPPDTAHLKTFCSPEPLAASLTSTLWPSVFASEGLSSDAIVSQYSQLDGLAGVSSTPLTAVHSKGAEDLGFGGPNALEQGSGVPDQVISLLNTNVTTSSTYLSNSVTLP